MRVIFLAGMLAALMPGPLPAQHLPAQREAVPLTVWSSLDAAEGIQRPGSGVARVQVVFDPFCPSSANLYRKVEQEYPGAAVRWIPVAYYRRNSATVARTLLDASSPYEAMGDQFTRLSQGTADVDGAGRRGVPAINPDILQSAEGLGAYTPMVFSRTPAGGVQLHRGHYSSAMDQALGRDRK